MFIVLLAVPTTMTSVSQNYKNCEGIELEDYKSVWNF